MTLSQRFGLCTATVGGSVCIGVMSDSEDESQDKQLKIVVIGDGACGKVRATAAGQRVGRGVEMYMQDKIATTGELRV